MISYGLTGFSFNMTKKGNEILLHLEILENELLYHSRFGNKLLIREMTDL